MGHVRQQDLLTSTCTSARTSHQAEARVHLYLDRTSRCGHLSGDRSTYRPSGVGRSTCSRSARWFCEVYGCDRRTGAPTQHPGVGSADPPGAEYESRTTNLPQQLLRAPLSDDVQEVRFDRATPAQPLHAAGLALLIVAQEKVDGHEPYSKRCTAPTKIRFFTPNSSRHRRARAIASSRGGALRPTAASASWGKRSLRGRREYIPRRRVRSAGV